MTVTWDCGREAFPFFFLLQLQKLGLGLGPRLRLGRNLGPEKKTRGRKAVVLLLSNKCREDKSLTTYLPSWKQHVEGPLAIVLGSVHTNVMKRVQMRSLLVEMEGKKNGGSSAGTLGVCWRGC